MSSGDRDRTDNGRERAEAALHEYLQRVRSGEQLTGATFGGALPAEVRDEFRRLLDDYHLLRERLGDPGQLLARDVVLGDFRLVEELGRGGMGVVWEAEQLSLSRRVALKLLSPARTLVPSALERFQREAEAAGRLTHPSIVAVYAVGAAQGRHFIAQELVTGGSSLADSIAEWKEQERAEAAHFRTIATFFADITAALHAAHVVGVVHRDIKPGNLLQTPEGHPKIADFGLAKLEGELTLSRSGALLGTPFYMSPEQAESRRTDIDARSDVFSTGTTLYECLTLERAFEAETGDEVLRRIIEDQPPVADVVRAEVPRDLATICAKAMEKQPEHRYATAKAFEEDLRRFLANRPVLARRPGPLMRAVRWAQRNTATVVAVCAVLVLLFGGTWQWQVQAARRRNLASDERSIAAATEKITSAARALYDAGVDPTVFHERLDRADQLLAGPTARPDASALGWIQLGRSRELRADLEGAEMAFREALELDPASASARFGLAKVLMRRARIEMDRGWGHGTAAGEAVELAREAAGSLPAGLERDLAELMADLAQSVSEGNASAFGDILERAGLLLERHDGVPGREELHLVRADVLAKLGRSQEVVAELDAALSIRPGFPELLVDRASYMSHDDPERARADLDHAIELQPGFADAYAERGRLRADQEDIEGALDDYDRALEIDPRCASALYHRGSLVGQLAFFDPTDDPTRRQDLLSAEADLTEVVALWPGFPQAHHTRALVRDALGDRAEAQADLERALGIEPSVAGFDRAGVTRLLQQWREENQEEEDMDMKSLAIVAPLLAGGSDSTSAIEPSEPTPESAAERQVWINLRAGKLKFRNKKTVVEDCPPWRASYSKESGVVWTYLSHPEGLDTWLFGLYLQAERARTFVEELAAVIEEVPESKRPQNELQANERGYSIGSNGWLEVAHDAVRVRVEADTRRSRRPAVRLVIEDGEKDREPVVVLMDQGTATAWHATLRSALDKPVVQASSKGEPPVWFNVRADLFTLDEQGKGMLERCSPWNVPKPRERGVIWCYLDSPVRANTWLFGLYVREDRATSLLAELGEAVSALPRGQMEEHVTCRVETAGYEVQGIGWIGDKTRAIDVRLELDMEAKPPTLSLFVEDGDRRPVQVEMQARGARRFHDALAEALRP